MIADHLENQQTFIDVILATRTKLPVESEDRRLVVAASNAMSILNYGAVRQVLPFRFDHIRDWSRIRVQSANLNFAQILNCNFSNSDLSNSTLVRAIVFGSNFEEANFTGVYTGEVGPLFGHAEIPYAELHPTKGLRFSPDGKRLVSFAPDRRTRIWDVQSGACITTLRNEADPRDVAIAPDGTLLAVVYGIDIQILDTTSWTRVALLEGHDLPVNCIDFSPNGNLLVSGASDCTIKVWNIASSTCVTTLELGSTVRGLSFSPDGKMIASRTDEDHIILWSLEHKTEVGNLNGEHTGVLHFSFSPDGNLLAAATRRDIYLWNLESKEFHSMSSVEPGISFVRFSPDGKFFASGCRGNLRLWHAKTSELISVFDVNRRIVGDALFDPNGKLTAAGWADGRIHIWDVRFMPCAASSFEYPPAILITGCRSDGKLVAVGDSNGVVTIWCLDSRRRVAILKKHTSSVWGLCFNSSGKLLASGSIDCTIGLWNAESWELITTITACHEVNSVCFSPDGTMLAANANEKVQLWSVESQALLASLDGHDQRVADLCFSHDGGLLVSCSYDGSIRLWDVQSHNCRAKLVGSCPYRPSLLAVGFSPCGKRFAAMSGGRILVWDMRSMRNVANVDHPEITSSLRFSSDGKFIAAGTIDKNIPLFDGATYRQLTTLPGHTCLVTKVEFSLDAKHLISTSPDTSVRVWRRDGSSWRLHAVFALTYAPDLASACFDKARVSKNLLLLCGRSDELDRGQAIDV